MQATNGKFLRLLSALWRQRARNIACPPAPRLDGKTALVTGGNGGIGFETVRGLAARGAVVIVAARESEKTHQALAALRSSSGTASIEHVPIDLADLRSVRAAANALQGRRLEILVLNAGVWPLKYATTAQGHELAFGTNVLGHFFLTRLLLQAAVLEPEARIVVVTGDLYITADGASPDFKYDDAGGGRAAYCRSKVGIMWFARELSRRCPEREVVLTHPGVVDTGLGGPSSGFRRFLRKRLLLDWQEGAQAPLFAATQAGMSGAYLHNTLGVVEYPEWDPALDEDGARAMWALCEELVGPFLPEAVTRK